MIRWSCNCRLWTANRAAAWEYCCHAWDVECYKTICIDREARELEGGLLAAELRAADRQAATVTGGAEDVTVACVCVWR